LFALHFAPTAATSAREGILLLPPFAEELNKSRALIATQARAFAAAGYDVLLLDLFGTGDSEGELGDASWPMWVGDLRRGADWLLGRGAGCVHLWAVRAGALFVSDLAATLDPRRSRLVFWHPVLSGRQFATQFLRLRVVAEIGSSGATNTEELRRELQARGRIEVAGYEITAELLTALEERTLHAAVGCPARTVVWLDIVAGTATAGPPASAGLLETWRKQLADIRYQTVVGEPFWGTVEIARLPRLVDATCALLASDAA
jgi:exosortase A-associated hydrolase 2